MTTLTQDLWASCKISYYYFMLSTAVFYPLKPVTEHLHELIIRHLFQIYCYIKLKLNMCWRYYGTVYQKRMTAKNNKPTRIIYF